MAAIMIQSDSESNRLLLDIAKKMGANVLAVNDVQFEDFALGSLMDNVKTNKTVSRSSIMKKLRK